MQTFTYHSKTDPGRKPYQTVVADDGRLGCDCRGWTTKKVGKPRECTHTKQTAARLGLQTVVRGDYVYAVLNGARPANGAGPAAPAPVVMPVTPPKAKLNPEAYVKPMLAQVMPDGATIDGYAANGTHILEEKFDGIRCTVSVDDAGDVDVWSRPRAGADVGLTRDLPIAITSVLADFPTGTYDCELTVPGGHSYDVLNLANTDKLVLVVFDVVRLLGHDITRDSWIVRRSYLDEIFEHEGSARVVRSVVQPVSTAAVEAIWARGGEGAIIKRTASIYHPGGRTADWIKVKAVRHAWFTITGFAKGENGPYSRTLLRDDAGIETRCKTLNAHYLTLIAANPQAFIGKRLLCEYQERTPDGKYRHVHWDRLDGE